MYTVSVKKKLTAYHFLTGIAQGPESTKHRHDYEVTVEFEGRELDGSGYLVDILQVNDHLGRIASRYEGRVLNDFPEFSGLNPSIERFSRVICRSIAERIRASNVGAVTVRVAENELASASYRGNVGSAV